MLSRPLELVRNLGIVAHVDAGKTTLTERILFLTGRIHAMGEVHEGTATTDDDPREQARGITISAAAVTCAHRGHVIQLIDTPGHVDFQIEVDRSLRVLDGAIVVVDAVAGVQPQTESVWRQADRHRLPRLVFVNKLDRAGASLERTLRSIESSFSVTLAPLVIALGEADSFEGVIDIVRRRSLTWRDANVAVGPVPTEMIKVVDHARARLVDLAADVVPAVAEAYLERGEVDDGLLLRALRAGTIAGAFVPVLAGAAYATKGVEPLLDTVVDLLPSPLDRPPVEGVDGERRPPSSEAPLSALCFKVVHDDWGQRAFVRVYSGVLRRGERALLARTGQRVRIGRLARLFAKSVEDIEEARAGDIAAVLGGAIATSETLCDPDHPIALESIEAPVPVIAVALEPKTHADRERMGTALARLVSEDPSLRLRSDPETGEVTLSGMGELHLEVALERLRDAHRASVLASPPRVAYRETITRPVSHQSRHIKQSGGPGQYAHVLPQLEPAQRGSGLTFQNRLRGGAIPAEYVPGVEKGIRNAATAGVLGGYPVVDVAVTLLDGSFHSNDSSELAFAICAERAFREAMRLAGPTLLEPLMHVSIEAPEASIGAVLGDLGARRGRVVALAGTSVTALVPLAELVGYAAGLRSLTQGRGRASTRLEGYAAVPEALVPAALAR